MKALVYNSSSPYFPWFHKVNDTYSFSCKTPSSAITAPLYNVSTAPTIVRIFNTSTSLIIFEYKHDPYLELPELFI